jgi:hypothetical protein
MNPPERTRINLPGECNFEKCTLVYENHIEPNEQRIPVDLHVDPEDGLIYLGVYPEDAAPDLSVQPGYSLSLRLTPAQARSIAYALLWYANDLTNPEAWKGGTKP